MHMHNNMYMSHVHVHVDMLLLYMHMHIAPALCGCGAGRLGGVFLTNSNTRRGFQTVASPKALPVHHTHTSNVSRLMYTLETARVRRRVSVASLPPTCQLWTMRDPDRERAVCNMYETDCRTLISVSDLQVQQEPNITQITHTLCTTRPSSIMPVRTRV